MPVSETRLDDSLFGPLTVHLDTERGAVTVEGEAIPRIVLNRASGTRADDHIPVGTRDAGLLTLTVAGEAAALAPGRGRLTRRSYRVDVRHAGHHRRLLPDSVPSSRLLRDGHRLGDLTSQGDGHVLAEWRPDAKPDATDVALAYALAAAFGTGAQPLPMLLADAIGDLIP
ncbi:hypothetical protein SLINC_4574 [Streptomyces lincolnensis]|uniref:Uncharacterized protein n=1 Tax=Streptomyces lincolnensis TaxID=1915 RepID=A0A1B1MDV6_STRLN|nr:hypothetical protein [Streptomyces lincolnensis]ANS66798.1 hypothetical protein SLINC_4574 [Streptomyces lincolnensis]AXG55669.1 hypothetical protein SLCG_4514 [Streptomyces lincolnensis]